MATPNKDSAVIERCARHVEVALADGFRLDSEDVEYLKEIFQTERNHRESEMIAVTKAWSLTGALAVMVLLLFGGCSHAQMDRDIDQKVQGEGEIHGAGALDEKTKQWIETAEGLSGEERRKLLELEATTNSRLHEMREESLKLRALLVRDLLQANDLSDECSRIEVRIKKLENERLQTMFSAVRQVNQILGRTHPQAEHIMTQWVQERGDAR